MRHYAISTLLALALGLGLTVGAVNVAVSTIPAHAADRTDPLFPRGLPWAEQEDECAYGVHRCVWDAKHRGNRTGRSYILTRDRSNPDFDYQVKYVKHRRAHRLATAWCQRRDVDCRY